MSKEEEQSIEDRVPEIVKNTMPSQMLADAVKWALGGIRKYKIDKDIAGLVKANFDTKYGGAWYVWGNVYVCFGVSYFPWTYFQKHSLRMLANVSSFS